MVYYTCSQRDVRAYATAASAAETSLQAGRIVAFKTETKQDLALLQRPNGKLNWFATDSRQVCLVAHQKVALQQITTLMDLSRC